MAKDYTELICILDRSGSMRPLTDSSIEGFNQFVKDQKKLPGKARLTLVLFDHEYFLVHDNIKLSKVPPLNKETYVPHGWTALLDAVGRTIDSAKERHRIAKHGPTKVFVAILTDGHENASKDYSQGEIEAMIKRQEKTHSWEFVFLAANIDATQAAGAIGIEKTSAFSFAASAMGTRRAYGHMSKSAKIYRTEDKTTAVDKKLKESKI